MWSWNTWSDGCRPRSGSSCSADGTLACTSGGCGSTGGCTSCGPSTWRWTRARPRRSSTSSACGSPRHSSRSSCKQTGGWPAGVRLAARSLAEADDADAYLADLAGNDRAIADYLVTEVLERLPPSTVEVLHAVSIGDQLPSSLVAALSGSADGVAELDALEHGSGLVTAYGPGRAQYRVHPLLRSHMQASLRRTRPQRVTELHQRAAGWYLDHGLPEEAVRHLRAARDVPALAALLRETGVELVEGGHGAAVLAAMEAIPDRDATLLAVLALAHLTRGELDAARHAIDRAGALIAGSTDDDPAAVLALARTRLALTEDRLFHGGHAESVGFAGLRGTWSDRLLAAESAIAAGRADEAERLIRPVLDDGRVDDFGRARATAVLAAATGLRGGFDEMADLARSAAALGTSTGRWEDTDGAALAAVLSAYAALMRCLPEETLDGLLRADLFVARLGPALVLTPFIDALRAAARFDLGRREPAADLMHRARTTTVVERARTEQLALVAMLAHRMAVQLGRRDEAQSVVSWSAARLEGTAELAVMRAAGPAGISRFDAAERLLRPVLDDSVPAELSWTPAEARLLDCAIALATGRRARAERALTAALRTADEVGVLRPLVTVPTAVADLMRARLGVLGDLDELAAEALAERERRGADALPALTAREHAVLLHLPSLRPLAEIARELGISPNTVKTHVKALYTKLGAASRRDAVDAAARLGLLREISPAGGDGSPRP